MKLFLALLLFCPAASVAFIGHASEAKDTITIGFNPAENSEVIETNGKRFSDYFKQKMGVNVKTFVSSDYIALVEALRSGRIDFAFLPPFSLVKAEQIANAQVLMMATRHGRAFTFSGIIVRSDKGFHKIEDLKGKNIAWVDPASASGFIFPKATLKLRNKIDADTFFGRQIFAGAHDAVVLAVLNGSVDAGATFVNDTEGKDGAWHFFLKTEADRKRIKMIYESDKIPSEAMATSKKFLQANGALVKEFTTVLGGMGADKEGREILKVLYNIDSMIPAVSKDFQPVRDAAKAIHID